MMLTRGMYTLLPRLRGCLATLKFLLVHLKLSLGVRVTLIYPYNFRLKLSSRPKLLYIRIIFLAILNHEYFPLLAQYQIITRIHIDSLRF